MCYGHTPQKTFTVKQVIVPILLLVLFPAIQAQTEPLDSDSNGAREVSTKDHLLWISTTPSSWSESFEQIQDIFFVSADFESGAAFYNDGAGFSPIGTTTTNFTGSYDGMGHVIDGLYCSATMGGLFGVTTGAEIRKLGITNCSIEASGNAGGLVAYCNGYQDNTLIEYCYSTGSVSGSTNVGGLVGNNIHSVIRN